MANTHTDNNIDLRAKLDHETLVTHKIIELKDLYDTSLCDFLGAKWSATNAKFDKKCHRLLARRLLPYRPSRESHLRLPPHNARQSPHLAPLAQTLAHRSREY